MKPHVLACSVWDQTSETSGRSSATRGANRVREELSLSARRPSWPTVVVSVFQGPDSFRDSLGLEGWKNTVDQAWRTPQAWRSLVFVSRRSFSPESKEPPETHGSREIQDSLPRGLDIFSLNFMLLGPRRVFMRGSLGMDLVDVPRIMFEGVRSTVRRSGGVLR